MTARPVSWINTAYPFAAGYLMMGGAVDARLIIGTLFFLIPYNLLMYGVNDVYDYESDMRNPRKGGAEGAVTPKSAHTLIVNTALLVALPFAVVLMSLGTAVSAAVLLGTLFFVVAYSMKGLRFKEIPLVDSITSSIHFVGPLVYAYSLVGGSPAGWLAAGAFFAWGMASHAFGAVQDIIPDRQAGIASIATALGARATVGVSAGLYSVAVVLAAAMGGWAWPVAGAGVAYVINIAPYVLITDATSDMAHGGWKRFMWLNYAAGAVLTVCCIFALMA